MTLTVPNCISTEFSIELLEAGAKTGIFKETWGVPRQAVDVFWRI